VKRLSKELQDMDWEDNFSEIYMTYDIYDIYNIKNVHRNGFATYESIKMNQ
jgi:hypothetical protein